jgi:hypothetical protein
MANSPRYRGPFKKKQQAEKARRKYSEKQRKSVGLGVIRTKQWRKFGTPWGQAFPAKMHHRGRIGPSAARRFEDSRELSDAVATDPNGIGSSASPTAPEAVRPTMRCRRTAPMLWLDNSSSVGVNPSAVVGFGSQLPVASNETRTVEKRIGGSRSG